MLFAQCFHEFTSVGGSTKEMSGTLLPLMYVSNVLIPDCTMGRYAYCPASANDLGCFFYFKTPQEALCLPHLPRRLLGLSFHHLHLMVETGLCQL